MNTTRPLRTALLANALFSSGSGLIMISNPEWVGTLLGFDAAVIIMFAGVGLVLFAVDLLHQATRQRMQTWRALYASAADFLWVLGSIGGVLVFHETLSTSGIVTVLVIAGIVFIFGAGQLLGIDRLHRNPETGLYRHCILVNTHVPADAIWKVIRDLGTISQYTPSLQESVLLDNKTPGIGAIRQCVDQDGRTWCEECMEFSDIERSFLLRFLTDEPGFPFPASYMLGGWSVMPATNGSTVMIWWELQPKPKLLAPLILPILAFQADRNFPALIARMAANATGINRQDNTAVTRQHRITSLLPKWC